MDFEFGFPDIHMSHLAQLAMNTMIFQITKIK
jgi:hypothetical protein